MILQVEVEVPQSEMRGGLSRSSDTEMWAPRDLLDQSGSNDYSAYKEIQELKDACAMLRSTISQFIIVMPLPTTCKNPIDEVSHRMDAVLHIGCYCCCPLFLTGMYNTRARWLQGR